jgi:hypothetical protein
MSDTSSGFLTKSVIVLSLFLVSMGVSLYIGKMLGRNIMSLTRSNIEERFPSEETGAGTGGTGSSTEVARSEFGFDEANFAPEEPPLWANPPENEFSVVSEEPSVNIAVLPEGGESALDGADGEQKPDTASTDGGEAKPDSNTDGNIFNLTDSGVFHIQVGTFEVEGNAESVWRRLTQAGYDAHISALSDSDGQRYKVFVGSYKTREEADSVAEQLRAMNFNAWVYQES